jgi:hypothetical protein
LLVQQQSVKQKKIRSQKSNSNKRQKQLIEGLMMRSLLHLLLSLMVLGSKTAAFLPPSDVLTARNLATRSYGHGLGTPLDGTELATPLSRKNFVERTLQSTCCFLVLGQIKPACASGGATAGGAYLLSAKQRYNKRVTAGLKAFLALNVNQLNTVNTFFETADEGGWEDLSAAAYLLANAFRTNSSKAPDTLPAVKSWKAFAKEIDLLKRALSKNDASKVAFTYKSAEGKLDDYLANVELPSVMELKQM